MVKFVKEEDELEKDLDKWLYVLKNMSRMKKIPLYLRKTIFEKLFNIAEYSNLTKEEKIMYDSSMKRKWDNENVLEYAVTEAEKKGVEKGEHKKALEIARKFKEMGIPTADISKGTGLSEEEVSEL